MRRAIAGVKRARPSVGSVVISLITAMVPAMFGSVFADAGVASASTSTPSCILTPTDCAVALLGAIPEPVTLQNIEAIVAWEEAEGGNGDNAAAFNPLNTTQPYDGSRPINGVGVQAYRSGGDGVRATLIAITNGRYGGVLAALQAGSDPSSVAAAVGGSPWGTPNFSSFLPPNYDRSGPWDLSCLPVPTQTSGIAVAGNSGGYWTVERNGGVFAHKGAPFYNSLPGVGVSAIDIVNIVSTPDGGGYWEVGARGGVFSFGDATFHGSMGNVRLNHRGGGMGATP